MTENKTKYTETKIFTTSQGAEPVIALLISFGINNVSVDDPQDVRELIISKEDSRWDFIDPKLLEGDDEAIITFYTEDNKEGNALLQQIKLDLMKLKSDEMYGAYGEDSDFGRMYVESAPLKDGWQDEWKKYFKPFKITDNIVIKPSWEDYEMKIDELIIELDPGIAFGSGSHETTKSCAMLLEETIKPGDAVLDIGTGSGILTIIASKCEAGKVDAYEIDGEAVEVAQNNFELNSISDDVAVFEADILEEKIEDKYDIIVANLTSGLIKRIVPVIKNSLKEGGHIILSGMLREEKDTMEKFFSDNNLRVNKQITDGEWYTVRI